MAKEIKIPAKWDKGNAVAIFKLGLGPCGKVVKRLTYSICDHYFHVNQETDDGEHKSFLYPHHTITGRIEITQGD